MRGGKAFCGKIARVDFLLVEDDPETRDYLVRGLSEAGHRVTVATSLAEAEAIAPERHWDAMILDRMLPPSASPLRGGNAGVRGDSRSGLRTGSHPNDKPTTQNTVNPEGAPAVSGNALDVALPTTRATGGNPPSASPLRGGDNEKSVVRPMKAITGDKTPTARPTIGNQATNEAYGDGLAFLARLRGRGFSSPVLILSALGAVEERVQGLQRGADDYLAKPFAFSELLARVEALARRTTVTTPETTLTYADLELDLLGHRAQRGGRDLHLQPREFRLLECLLRNVERTVTRTMLFEKVWGYHFDAQSGVIDVHISRLRSKLDKNFSTPLLHTVRGTGYRLAQMASVPQNSSQNAPQNSQHESQTAKDATAAASPESKTASNRAASTDSSTDFSSDSNTRSSTHSKTE